MRPPIKRGPQGGRYQPEPGADAKKRGLLKGKVKTGPQGGKYQSYGRGKKRFLLQH